MSVSILIVDDDQSMCGMLESGLKSAEYETASSNTADAALDLMSKRDFDVVITDVRMKRVNGFELCERIAENRPDIPVIVITAFGSMETAVQAIRAGAYDFITKPFDLDTIRLVVKRAAERRALSKKIQRLEQALRETREFSGMIGTSQSMKEVFDLVQQVAPSDTAVLITGESGTGKELVARALHSQSNRKKGPFVAINCAAMPETLLESELFGHVKGAFTDARADRQGLFKQADGGTLFLDEIGELPLSLQPKLLRALQEKTARPIGGREEIPFDARLVAATNRDLESAMQQGRFREDLYYRIHVIQIDVPPLRSRGNDILILAQHYLEHFASVTGKLVKGMLHATADKLLAYSWPGNVREMQNCIERAVTLCRYEELSVEDLPPRIRDFERPLPILPDDNPGELAPMEEIERRYILHVFEATGKNKSLTAKILDFNRKTLYRKLRQYGVIPKEGQTEDD